MLKDLFQLYQIGKELGLTKKEINRSFSFKDESHSFKNKLISSIILLIILILIGATIIVATQIGYSGTTSTNSTYPSGIRYSTIRIKDFKKKLRYYIQIR